MNPLNFDVERQKVTELACTGQQILQQTLRCQVPFSKVGVEQLDKWMLALWKDIPPDPDQLSDEEQEMLGYLAAFLGECVLETLGGAWGRTGPFFDEHYYIRVPVPSGIPYDINPGLRVTRCYFDPVKYSIRDWYARAELASLGRLDPLLNGAVHRMIVPSVFGRVVIKRHPDLIFD